MSIAAALSAGCAGSTGVLREIKVGETTYVMTNPAPLMTGEVTALTIHRSYVSVKPGSGAVLIGPHARSVAPWTNGALEQGETHA